MVRKISILIFVSLLSISNSTIALELLSDLDEPSDCESCYTEINFDEGGCIISVGEIVLNFAGDGAIDFGEDGYLDLGEGGYVSGYDEEVGRIEVGGMITLGENGRIVVSSDGGIRAEEGFMLEALSDSSLVFYDGENYLSKCAIGYDEVYISELAERCDKQLNSEVAGDNALISNSEFSKAGSLTVGNGVELTNGDEVISVSPISGEITAGGISGVWVCRSSVELRVVDYGEIKKIEDGVELAEQSEDPQTQNSGGGVISLYMLLMLVLIRSKDLFGKM